MSDQDHETESDMSNQDHETESDTSNQDHETEPETSNQDLVREAVRSYFPNDVAIAAVMGNIEVETGGSFDYTQKQRGGNGYGLFQFDFMKPYYLKWLTEVGLDDSADSQVKFAYETIYGNKRDIIGAGNASKVANALNGDDVDTATTVFCTLWEKPGVPHLDRRLAAAQGYIDLSTESTDE